MNQIAPDLLTEETDWEDPFPATSTGLPKWRLKMVKMANHLAILIGLADDRLVADAVRSRIIPKHRRMCRKHLRRLTRIP